MWLAVLKKKKCIKTHNQQQDADAERWNVERTHSFFHIFSQSSGDGEVLYHPLGVDRFSRAGLATEGTEEQRRGSTLVVSEKHDKFMEHIFFSLHKKARSISELSVTEN